MKECYTCGFKGEDNLFISNGRNEYLECKRKYDREYHKNRSKEKKYSNQVKRKRKIQDFIIEYLNKHPCVDCGMTDIRVLDFDHIERDKKEFMISTAIKNGYSEEVISKEIEKCDIRCSNCHRIKTSDEMGWYKSLLM